MHLYVYCAYILIYDYTYMNAKLNLLINKGVITRAKEFAEQHGLSLSEMVEDYFILLTQDAEAELPDLTPIVRSLKGSFKAPDDFDYTDY